MVDVVYGAKTRGWEKYFCLFSKDLQIVVILGRKFLKKYFASNEKGCNFAAVFRQRIRWQRTREIWNGWEDRDSVCQTLVLRYEGDTKTSQKVKENNSYNEEFDPGSGWTLAAGLTHASRGAARSSNTLAATGARVRNAYATYL